MPLPKRSQPTTDAAKESPALAPPLNPEGSWKPRTQTPMKAWDTPGQVVGPLYYAGLRDSTKYEGRKLVDLVDDDGAVDTYPCPVILEQLLRGLPDRAVVMIHYRGEADDANGTKQFEVFTQ